MKLQPDDPKLTAYALGELDASEAAVVATAIEQSAECQRAVEETRQTVGLLTAALQTEPCAQLSAAQRGAIQTALAATPKAPAKDKTVRARPSFLAALFAWRPQYATIGIWATAYLVATLAWSLWFGAFRTSDKDGVGVVSCYSIALKPTSGVTSTFVPSPPPPPTKDPQPRVLERSIAPAPRATAMAIPAPVAVRPVTINAPVANNRLSPAPTGSGVVGAWGVGGRDNAYSAYGTRGSAMGRYGSQSAGVKQFPSGSRYVGPFNTEAYDRIGDNPFHSVVENPLSTFSIDVDTASYANVRRFLMQGSLPPRNAVRIEEMINYFTYDYVKPKRGEPFSVNAEAAGCPWNSGHRLVRIGLKGREVSAAKRPPCNLVFLIDVSGSMADANKLSLIKPALRMLVERLTENERVGIVVYNQSARVVLQSTSGDRKQEIIDAIESLQANGSTNGGDGIRLAYDMATRHFVGHGVNRVILCTDGDFNVGTTEQAELTRLIEQKRQSGVFLSVLGLGAGNLKDATLERLADKGNGHYAYIDTFFEARKVLVEQMNGTLVTIAKDVKIQVEFNPAKVAGYRLIGYEDRLLRKEDFNNDRKDAGEIGAGHTVTALYEIVPAGQPLPPPPVDPLKYQPAPKPAAPTVASEEWLTVKLRYKQPDGDKSALIEQTLTDGGKSYAAASRDFKFATAVASFGMVLRDSPHKGNATLAAVLDLAEEGRGTDVSGYRTEFLSLVKKAQALAKK